jgi:hypothetical protein
MEILTIKDFSKQQLKILNAKKTGELCICGSKEVFLAPIVHLRCNKCKQPIPNIPSITQSK